MPPLTSRSRRPSAEARFEALVRPHYDPLYRIAWRWTRSTQDAEDLVQETLARAGPRLGELERLDRPRSWLARIMYRLFIDAAGRREPRKTLPLDSPEQLSGSEPGPQERTDRARNAERVAQVWPRMDREGRALLALHDIEGYTLTEIAEMTGLREATLKARLHRARVLLGRLLDPDCVVTTLETGGLKR